MNKELLEQIEEAITPALEGLGCECVDLEYLHEKSGMVLRIYIDKPEGINISDCEHVSRSVSDLLDAENIIDNHYNLEVSSPGADRPLRKLDHFKKFIGSIVKIKTVEPIDGRSNYKGSLESVVDKIINVQVDNQLFAIPHQMIAKACIVA